MLRLPSSNMPRSNSLNWATTDPITAVRLHDFNQDLDDLYAYGDDRLRVNRAASGTALKIDIGAGAARVGTVNVTYAGETDRSVTDSATNYVEMDASGTVLINTTGWTSVPQPLLRLAEVVASGGVITSITLWKTDSVGGNLSGINPKFGDGSDGALNVTSGTTQIDCNNQSLVIKNYTSFNVSAGATLEFINVPDEGLVFVPLVQGNYTMAGTIDARGDGSKGGATLTNTSMGVATVGNAPTTPFNAFGESHAGGGGNASARGSDAGSQYASQAAATGAGGSGNNYNDGASDGTQVTPTFTGGAVNGGSKGLKRTLNLTSIVAGMIEAIGVAPATGGATGAICIKSVNGTGSITVTAGAGGRGGAVIMPIVGGNYNFTGTVDVRGTDATAGSYNTASAGISGGNGSWAVAYGGSAGGAGGFYLPMYAGTLTANSGTVSVTAGASGTGAGTQASAGLNANNTQAYPSNAGNSAAGFTMLMKVFVN